MVVGGKSAARVFDVPAQLLAAAPLYMTAEVIRAIVLEDSPFNACVFSVGIVYSGCAFTP